jgi:hypothetical protein
VAGERRKKMIRMRFFSYIFIAGICITTLIACSKTGGPGAENPDQIDQNDDVFPVLTVSKPGNNQVYASGDSIVVQGYATDNKVMYKGSVKIINDATGVTEKSQLFETHFLLKLDFYVAYKTSVTSITNYTVLIEFQDHGANTVSQTLKVKVNP